MVQHFWDTMSYHKLPILSGPEVDVPLRIVTLDPSLGMDSACRVVLINPEIAEESRALEEANEGCACVPEVTAVVARPARVVVEALDCEGKRNELVFESVEARLICHECDHLEGVLFVDCLGLLARSRLLRAARQTH